VADEIGMEIGIALLFNRYIVELFTLQSFNIKRLNSEQSVEERDAIEAS
jgi:hypothetical protein